MIEDTVNFSLKGSRVRCEFFMDNSLWPVEIDDAQISQVINNLIINANQAMPNGGIIKVCVKNATVCANDNLPLQEGKYIALSVKDQGIGISPKDLHKIFDPYFTTKEDGSGIGLAVSYSIVKKHEGYMRAESEVGVGTTFDIYLPALEIEREIFTVKDIEEERIYFGKGRILLMDDQQSVREMVGEILRDIGYEVEFAKEGNEALELYRRAVESGQIFDAVIVDLTIPDGMGGDEVIRKLHEKNSEARVIVTSGYSNDPIMSEYRKYGFSGVVAKPYGIVELSKVLYKVINGIEEAIV